MFVEMEQMASRPFAAILLQMDKVKNVSLTNNSSSAQLNTQVDNGTLTATPTPSIPNVTLLNSINNPTPIALEPCVHNKAAVITLLVKLPTGGKSVPPSG